MDPVVDPPYCIVLLWINIYSSFALFNAKVQNFGKPSVDLLKLKEAKSIGFGDMQLELQKIETSLTKLKADNEKILKLNIMARYTNSLTVLL